MSLQTTPPMNWIEIRLESPTQKPQGTVEEAWTALRRFFTEASFPYANYLSYISTDLSGGINLCSPSVLGQQGASFLPAYPLERSGFPTKELDLLWDSIQNKKFDEMDLQDWELLGFGFLFLGKEVEFQTWIGCTKNWFGLSKDLQAFLFVLGWETGPVDPESQGLRLLCELKMGKQDPTLWQNLVSFVQKENAISLLGILLHAIRKGFYSGSHSQSILVQLFQWSGFQTETTQTTLFDFFLEKLQPFFALRMAKKTLTKKNLHLFRSKMKDLYRGDWLALEDLPLDKQLETLETKFNKDPQKTAKDIQRMLLRYPNSYDWNFRKAIISFYREDYKEFLAAYRNSGRLQYLPIALYLYSKVLRNMGDHALASSIEVSLEKNFNSLSVSEE